MVFDDTTGQCAFKPNISEKESYPPNLAAASFSIPKILADFISYYLKRHFLSLGKQRRFFFGGDILQKKTLNFKYGDFRPGVAGCSCESDKIVSNLPSFLFNFQPLADCYLWSTSNTRFQASFLPPNSRLCTL